MKYLLFEPLGEVEKGLTFVDIPKENALSYYYDLLECSCIDICTRTIDGKQYDFVIDDEGFLKENPIVSAFGFDDNFYVIALAGNLLIIPSEIDDDGNFSKECTQEDYNHICKNIIMNFDENHYEICNLDY